MGFYAAKKDIYTTGGALQSASGAATYAASSTTTILTVNGIGVFYYLNCNMAVANVDAGLIDPIIELDGNEVTPGLTLLSLANQGYTDQTDLIKLSTWTDEDNPYNYNFYPRTGLAFNESLVFKVRSISAAQEQGAYYLLYSLIQ